MTHHLEELEVCADRRRSQWKLARTSVIARACIGGLEETIIARLARLCVSFATSWREPRVSLIPSASFNAAVLKAVTALVASIALLVSVGCGDMQVASELGQHRRLSQLVVCLDEFAHEEWKSRGQGIDTLLNRQTFEPAFERFNLRIFLWVRG